MLARSRPARPLVAFRAMPWATRWFRLGVAGGVTHPLPTAPFLLVGDRHRGQSVELRRVLFPSPTRAALQAVRRPGVPLRFPGPSAPRREPGASAASISPIRCQPVSRSHVRRRTGDRTKQHDRAIEWGDVPNGRSMEVSTPAVPARGRARNNGRRGRACPVPLFEEPACPARATTRVAPTNSPCNSRGCGFVPCEDDVLPDPGSVKQNGMATE